MPVVTDPNIYIGPPLPDQAQVPNHLCPIMHELYRQIVDAESPIDRHFPLVFYILMHIWLVTGVRPGNDPFAYFHRDMLLALLVGQVSDKTLHYPTHGNRPFWYTPYIRELIRYYLRHLGELSAFSAEHKKYRKLGRAILGLLDTAIARDHQPIAFFFDIGTNGAPISLRLRKVAKHLAGNFPYRLKSLRQCCIHMLYELVEEDDLVSPQSGHVPFGKSPFGKSRSWSPDDYGRFITPMLVEVEKAFLPCHKFPVIKPTTLPHLAPLRRRLYTFSDDEKARARASYAEEATSRLIILLKEALNIKNLSGSKLSPKDYKRVVQTIHKLADSDPELHKTLLDILNKHLQVLYLRTGEAIVPMSVPAGFEPSPFYENFFSDYTVGRKLRNRLMEIFSGRRVQRTRVTPARRIAEIIATLICEGGLLCTQSIEAAVEDAGSSIYRFRDQANWRLSFYDPDGQKSKYSENIFFTPTARALLSALDGVDLSKIDSASVARELTCLLQELNEKKLKKLSSLINKTIRTLEPYFIYHFPPYIRKHLATSGATHSFSLETLFRFSHDKHIHLPSNSTSAGDSDSLTRRRASQEKRSRYLSSAEYYDLANAALNSAESLYPAYPKRARSHLDSLLSENSDTGVLDYERLTPLQLDLTNFLLRMCTLGTPKKKNPVIDTLRKYFQTVAQILMWSIEDQDPTHIPSEMIEDIYVEIIECHSDPRWALFRCLYFQEISEDNGSFPAIEPAPLYSAAGCAPLFGGQAEAITSSEYAIVIGLINLDENQSRVKRDLAILLAMLGYHLGLRLRESLFLVRRDLQNEEDIYSVIVQWNRLRRGKTSNAYRPIEIEGELLQIEKEIFKRSAAAIGDPVHTQKDYVFSEHGSDDVLLKMADCVKYLKQTMALVTGVDDFHFHLLRHSNQNSRFSRLILPHLKTHFARELIAKIGGVDPIDYPATATPDPSILMQLLGPNGHGQSGVFLTSYGHNLSILALDIASDRALNTKDSHAKAYICNGERNATRSMQAIQMIDYTRELQNFAPTQQREHTHLHVLTAPEGISDLISFSQVNMLLKLYVQCHGNSEQAIRLSGLQEDSARRVISAAQALESTLELPVYYLDDSPSHNSNAIEYPKVLSKLNTDASRLDRTLAEMDHGIFSSGNAVDILATWPATLKRQGRGYAVVCRNNIQLNAMLFLMYKIGFSDSQIAIRCASTHRDSLSDQFTALKDRSKLTVIEKTRPSRWLQQGSIEISIRRVAGAPLQYIQSLVQALFIITCTINLSKNLP